MELHSTTRVRRGENRTCKTCGNLFYVYPSALNKPGRTNEYCSNKCKGPRISETQRGRVLSASTKAKLAQIRTGTTNPARQLPPILLTCQHCQNTYQRSGRDRHHARRARFCSSACWYAYVRENPGVHPRYTGTYLPYYGPDWLDQARRARRRDGYACQDCGKRQVRPQLDVHHIVPRAAFGDDYKTANALHNLITLCKSCHTKREHAERKA